LRQGCQNDGPLEVLQDGPLQAQEVPQQTELVNRGAESQPWSGPVLSYIAAGQEESLGPDLLPESRFHACLAKARDSFQEARARGLHPRPLDAREVVDGLPKLVAHGRHTAKIDWIALIALL